MIVDTTVLIDAERDNEAFERAIADQDDVAIAAITAAELLVGVELADRRRRERRAAYVTAVHHAVSIEPYDLEVAREHARLLAYVRRSGTARSAHDLMIAATAVARDREVVSSDAAAFERLPGVVVRAV